MVSVRRCASPSIGSSPPVERRVGEQRVEIDRRLGHRDRMAPRRDRAVQIGQRLAVIERRGPPA